MSIRGESFSIPSLQPEYHPGGQRGVGSFERSRLWEIDDIVEVLEARLGLRASKHSCGQNAKARRLSCQLSGKPV
jgi:hypothetical protein